MSTHAERKARRQYRRAARRIDRALKRAARDAAKATTVPVPVPDAEPAEAPHPEAEAAPARRRGPIPAVLPWSATADDGDTLSVVCGKTSDGTAVVRVQIHAERGTAMSFLWRTDHARNVAAAIVTAADLASGTRPEPQFRAAPRVVVCDQSPADVLTVRTVPERGNRPASVVVAGASADNGSGVSWDVPAPVAYRAAAAILNAADHAEGRETLAAL